MAIVIDLKMTNSGTSRALDRLEKALDRMDGILNRVNKTVAATAAGLNNLAGAMSGGGGRGGSGGGRSSAGSRGPRRQKTAAEEFIDVLKRTRFDFRDGHLNMMPLGRDLFGKFGPKLFGMMTGTGKAGKAALGGGMSVPPVAGGAAASGAAASAARVASLGAAAGAAAIAVVLLIASMTSATRTLADFARDGAKYGGSPGQLSAAQRIANATGASIGSFAGDLGPGAAAAGINPLGGPYGDMNYSEKFRKAAAYVAKAKTMDQARRRAAMVGDESLANIHLLREDQRARMLNPNRGKFDTGSAKAAVQLMADLQSAWEDLSVVGTKFLSPMIRIVAAGAKKLADALHAMELIFQRIYDWLVKIGLIRNSGGNKKDPIQANTAATEELTRTMREQREIMGGGPRAQGALPSKFREGYSGRLQDIRLANI